MPHDEHDFNGVLYQTRHGAPQKTHVHTLSQNLQLHRLHSSAIAPTWQGEKKVRWGPHPKPMWAWYRS